MTLRSELRDAKATEERLSASLAASTAGAVEVRGSACVQSTPLAAAGQQKRHTTPLVALSPTLPQLSDRVAAAAARATQAEAEAAATAVELQVGLQ